MEPFRLPPPWSTYLDEKSVYNNGMLKRRNGDMKDHLAVLLKTRNMGTIPLEAPFVPRMYEFEARIL